MDQDYNIDLGFDSSNNPEGLCVYTDGSKLNNNAGYGAVYIHNGDIARLQ